MQSKYFFHFKWISPALICTHHFRISQNSCEIADLSYVWISLLEMKKVLWNSPCPIRRRDNFCFFYKHMQVHSKKASSFLKGCVTPGNGSFSGSCATFQHHTAMFGTRAGNKVNGRMVSLRHRQSSLITSHLHPWKGNSPGDIFVSLRQDRPMTINTFNS